MKPNTLYRFFDAENRLLYVGITCDPGRRLQQHRDRKDWWAEVARVDMEHFRDRASLLTAERAAIKAEAPAFNVRMNGGAVEVELARTGLLGCCGLQVGGVYAIGLDDGDCPVGRVIEADEGGVVVELFNWIVGMFDGPDRWYPAESIRRWQRGYAVSAQAAQADGWAAGLKVYDMDPLARFQTEWEDRRERSEAVA